MGPVVRGDGDGFRRRVVAYQRGGSELSPMQRPVRVAAMAAPGKSAHRGASPEPGRTLVLPSAPPLFRGPQMLQRSLRSPLTIGALFLSVLFCAEAPRDDDAQDQGATAFIQNLGTQGLQALSGPEPQRVARFRQMFDSNFDVPGISRFVLGQYANSLAPEQQQEFTTLFRDYIAHAYSARLAPYAGAPFRVTGAKPYGGETIVSSEVTRSGGQPTRIDWHVMNHGGRYVVNDVNVQGVSMKITQRSEFAAIIQRNGGQPTALLAALRQQIGQSTGSSAPRR